MNANSYNLEIEVERSQVEEAILSVFHTILFHRSTGKFDYKDDKTFAVGAIGMEDVDCDFIDFTYVRAASKKLDTTLKMHIERFRDQLQENSKNGVAVGTITLEFYQKRQGKWPFAEDCVPWEIWNLEITERVLNSEHEKNLIKEKTSLKLVDKLMSIVEAVGKHEFVPKQPEMTKLALVYDTTFPDVQPYLFKMYHNFGSTFSQGTKNSVGVTVRRLFNEMNI